MHIILGWGTTQQQPGKQDGADRSWFPTRSSATVACASSAESSCGAGSAHDTHRVIKPLLALAGLLRMDAPGTMASHMPAGTGNVCRALSQPCFLSLQSSKVVQGLTGLRNLGNTVSAYPDTRLHGPSSHHTFLQSHMWSGESPVPSPCCQHSHFHPGGSLHLGPIGAGGGGCSCALHCLVPILWPPTPGVPLSLPSSLCLPLSRLSLLPPPVLHELHPAVPEQHQGAAGLLPAEPIPAGPQQQQPHAHRPHVR